jgi:hypothetical protein
VPVPAGPRKRSGLPAGHDLLAQLAWTFFEDTAGGLPVHCTAGAAADFYASNDLAPAAITQYGKP